MTVIAINHPLVRHKVGLLREDDISTKKFRELTNELARLLAYEATADFPLEKTTIECWSGPTEIDRIAETLLSNPVIEDYEIYVEQHSVAEIAQHRA